jgi:hypothetical protein
MKHFFYEIDKKKGTAPIKAAPHPTLPPPTSSPAVSAMINGMKPSPNITAQTLPSQTTPTVSTPKVKDKKEPKAQKGWGFGTLGRKSKAARPDISAPIQSSYVKENFL